MTTFDLAVILPTYNECENIPLVMERLRDALAGIAWEAIFVDDDSPDGTADLVRSYAVEAPNIRLVHRVGRRGLASACLEGMMAAEAPFLAIMDADLQHDETILPEMLSLLRRQSLDLVVGTRNASGGSMGDFGRTRLLLSRIGHRIGLSVCNCELSDPMSGFFMLRRDFACEVAPHLHCEGFKILLDLIASSHRPVRLGEVGYTFRARRHGKSKLDMGVGLDFLWLVLSKLMEGSTPLQLMASFVVCGFGLMTHLASLLLLAHHSHLHFMTAQLISASAALTENFLLINLVTRRDHRMHGTEMISGAGRFALTCSLGVWLNVAVASALLQAGMEWYLAGLAGVILGSVWNLSIGGIFTWRPLGFDTESLGKESLPSIFEVSR